MADLVYFKSYLNGFALAIFPVLGNGDNIYQFVRTDDLYKCNYSTSSSNIKSGIYNCGTDKFGSMRDSLEKLCMHAKTGSNVKNIPFNLAVYGMKISSSLSISPLGDYHALMYGRNMYFDISKIKKDLNWNPVFSNEEMFIESYEWYINNREHILNSNDEGSHSIINQKSNKVF